MPSLKVSISRRLKEVVERKYKNAGAQKGKYIVIHGIKSDSKASMQSRGDTDSLLPIELWAEIASVIRYGMYYQSFLLIQRAKLYYYLIKNFLINNVNSGLTPVFVIPHEKERENVEDVVGDDASIVFITTPGQVFFSTFITMFQF